MRLFLVQHGEAKAEAEDPDRPLTERGREEATRVANAARRLRLKPAIIYHSGKLRAKQTAEIFSAALQQPVEFAPGLNPNDDIRPWNERAKRESEDIMLVGHLPFLDKLSAHLLAGYERARMIFFRYAAIICLERREDQTWGIRWLLTPEMVL